MKMWTPGRYFSIPRAKYYFILLISLFVSQTTYSFKVLPSPNGAYHGAYADFGALEEDVTEEKIKNFENLAGKKLAWAYFSNHWHGGKILFPQKSLDVCKSLGVIPYIRMQPWSNMEQNRKDSLISMQGIIDGEFDDQLKEWAKLAHLYNSPIMIEFGPEVNGDWFPWNGKWNGGGTQNRYGSPQHPDGPERYRDAYRRVIQIFRSQNAHNITWVFHVDAARSPHAEWNDVKYYYPGDDYIDWIGVSVFGRQLPQNSWIVFPIILKNFASQIRETTTSKPWMISEFAVIEDESDPLRKPVWLRQALQSISRGLFPEVKGITYWNSPGWLKNGRANFKIDSSPQSLEMYRKEIASPFWLDKALVERAQETSHPH